MGQDRQSGAEAARYGLQTAKKIALKLGARKVGRYNSNEYELNGKRILIKCARKNTDSIGAEYHMLERLDSILGSFEADDESYEIYELSPVIFSENMKPTRSRGASSGRVGMVKKMFFKA